MKRLSILLAGMMLGGMALQAQDLIPAPAAGSPESRPALSAPATRAADDRIIYGYCGNTIQTGFGYNSGSLLTAMIEIPEAVSQSLQGNQVSAIRFGCNTTNVKNASVVLYREISTSENPQTPFRSQTTSVSSGRWKEVNLEEPWTIDGKKFYVGYELNTISNSDYPIGCDYIYDPSLLGDIVMINRQQYTHCGAQFGNLCIEMIVTGDHLPQYDVSLKEFALQQYYSANDPFSTTVKVTNKGVKPFDTLELEMTVGGEEIDASNYTLSPSVIEPGSTGTLTITDLRYEQEKQNVEVVLKVAKVNGENDAAPLDNTVSGGTTFIPAVYPKAFVVEEWTGTWCAYCVRGIVGLEYMKKKYGDQGFIGIAVHGGGEDPMIASSYNGFLKKFCGDSYPGCVINRNAAYTIDPNKSNLETFFLAMKDAPSPFWLKARSTYDPEVDKYSVKVNYDFKSAISEDIALYRIAVVVLEDQVGPYAQSNAYANSREDMDGWENRGSNVPWKFDDVARDISSWTGNTKSLPSKFVKGEVFSNEITVSTRNVSNIENARLVLLMIDSKNSGIVNAWQCPINGESPDIEDNYNPGNEPDNSENAIGSVGGEADVWIASEAGAIIIFGDYAACSVYGIDGSHAATFSGRSSYNVAPGAYIVRVTDNGGRTLTRKLFVK